MKDYLKYDLWYSSYMVRFSRWWIAYFIVIVTDKRHDNDTRESISLLLFLCWVWNEAFTKNVWTNSCFVSLWHLCYKLPGVLYLICSMFELLYINYDYYHYEKYEPFCFSFSAIIVIFDTIITFRAWQTNIC